MVLREAGGGHKNVQQKGKKVLLEHLPKNGVVEVVI